MKIYNTLTKKKETIEPKDKKNISFFVCGPTVYDYSHLGHARTYVSFDAFVKYLRKNDFNVFYLQNITDIDDKIIQRARENNENFSDLSERFEKEYFYDMSALRIDSVSKYARATDHVEEIISQISRLIEKDFAYTAQDGVYYDISKFKGYGKLSGRTSSQAEDGTSRIDESVQKKNKGDFCIWKLSKEDEPKWDSPWGIGRPGWHIEDTAIAEKFFGPQYDIHGGGRDLTFPHHEAEISIMEAISEKVPFVKYWMHTGFLTIKEEKMSKSLNNFVTIRDFISNHSSRILRFLILKSHYRSPFDYNEDIINQAYQELKRIDQFISNIEKTEKKDGNSNVDSIIQSHQKELNNSLNEDFNTPLAISKILSFITEVNLIIDNISETDAQKITSFLKEIDDYFNFIFAKENELIISYEEEENLTEEIKKIIQEREAARKEKDFQKADEIRDQLLKMGYLIEDTKGGFKIKKI